jgi:hypothetical protein
MSRLMKSFRAAHRRTQPLPGLRFHPQQIQNLLPRNSKDFYAFVAAVFAGEDSNSRLWPFQKIGEQSDQRFIGAILHRRRTQPNLQRAIQSTYDLIATRARLHPHRKRHRSASHVFGKIQKAH